MIMIITYSWGGEGRRRERNRGGRKEKRERKGGETLCFLFVLLGD